MKDATNRPVRELRELSDAARSELSGFLTASSLDWTKAGGVESRISASIAVSQKAAEAPRQ